MDISQISFQTDPIGDIVPKEPIPDEMYHCTTLDRLKSILTHGLEPRKPLDAPTQPRGVYFTPQMFEWMWRATERGKHKGVMLKVDLKGFQLHDVIGPVVSGTRGVKYHRGFYVTEIVPVDRIVEILIEQDDKGYIPVEREAIL